MILIVGAGLSGLVLVERFASRLGKKVLIIEKRGHIGGNVYDYIDENGILINRYGAHIFHTNDEGVWEYVNRFAEWVRWDHKVLGRIGDRYFPIPININTVNILCNRHLRDEQEMDHWLSENQIAYPEIRDSEQVAKSRIGEYLYEKIIKWYTFKQWARFPSELNPNVLERIGVRSSHDDRYFTDRYQALPRGGYTRFCQSLIRHPNIQVFLNTDFFDTKDIEYEQLFFTGPIDQYFKDMEKLEYRSLRFEVIPIKNMNYYQPVGVVNYTSMEVPFTRIVEYKHFLNQKSDHTTIVKEYSTDTGEPYYPVLSKRNLDLYQKYKERATREKNVHFVGRLANYRYFNMDQAIRNSLDLFADFIK